MVKKNLSNRKLLAATAMATAIFAVPAITDSVSAAEVSTWSELRDAIQAGGETTLTSNINLSGNPEIINAAATATLIMGENTIDGTNATSLDHRLITATTGNLTVNGGTVQNVKTSSNWGSFAHLTTNGNLTINNTKFTGNSSNAAGVLSVGTAAGSITLNNVTFENNSANGIGAVGLFKAASFNNVVFKNNRATDSADAEYGAGALFMGSVSTATVEGNTIEDSLFEGNTSATRGGAVAMRDFTLGNNSAAKLDINNTTFKNNTATTNGGAIDNYFYNDANNDGYVKISNSTFTGNSAANGGAIYNHKGLSTEVLVGGNPQVGSMYITGSTFTDNSAQFGGAVYNEGDMALENASFTGNTASARGGAIFNSGNLVVDDGIFDSNTSTSYGGSVFSSGNTTIKNSSFTNNYSDYVGGAITTLAGTTSNLIVDNTTFDNNHTRYDGGAIGNYSGLSITKSKFTNNTADYLADTDGNYTILVEDDTAIGGGAISLGAVSATSIGSITETSFIDNKSGTYGGAIGTRFGKDADNSSAKLDISADFSGNEAHISGGAIYNTFYANNGLGKGDGVTVTGTFDGNVAGQKGGAVYNDSSVDKKGNHGGVMTFTNSTFTNNTAGTAGGAIYNDGVITLAGTNTFSGNTANGVKNDIHNLGTLNLNGTTSLESGITGAGTVSLGVSSITSMIGEEAVGSSIITASTLNITDGAKIAFDWGDTINAAAISGTATKLGVAGVYVDKTVGISETTQFNLFQDGTATIDLDADQLAAAYSGYKGGYQYTLAQDGSDKLLPRPFH